jgi:hypothetical protein
MDKHKLRYNTNSPRFKHCGGVSIPSRTDIKTLVMAYNVFIQRKSRLVIIIEPADDSGEKPGPPNSPAKVGLSETCWTQFYRLDGD